MVQTKWWRHPLPSQEEEEEGTSKGCPLLAAEGQREFPYRALAAVRDIEELAELGKQEGTCAYYGARKAAALAQVRQNNAT